MFLFGAGVWYSISYLEYDPIYSLYFVVSTIMGVGIVALDQGSTSDEFVLTAVYSMVQYSAV